MADVFRLLGVDTMKANLRMAQTLFPDQMARALKAEGEIETTEAKKRTPVYVGPTGPGRPIPGLLRDSVHLEGPFHEGRRISVKIVAGGAAGAYAIPQHEIEEYFHVVGQWKYIESVIMESRSRMAARLAQRLREQIKYTGKPKRRS